MKRNPELETAYQMLEEIERLQNYKDRLDQSAIRDLGLSFSNAEANKWEEWKIQFVNGYAQKEVRFAVEKTIKRRQKECLKIILDKIKHGVINESKSPKTERK